MTKIKASILALVLGAAALTSCNKDLHGPEAYFSDGEIIFGSRGVLVETKAFTETTNDVLQASGFGVAAVFDSDNSVMFNAAVAYNSTDGVYRGSNRYYYPATGTLTFYGVYPSSQAITLTSGVATLAYTQNADTDLVGVAVKNVAKQNNPVQMDFEHLLSQVTVQCKGYDANVDYKVTSISIKNANGGTYAYADDSWTRSSTLADYSYLSTATTVATDAMTSVGSPMSFVPGDIDLTIAWTCYNKGTETVVSSNEETVSTTIAQGKHTSINLTLPSNTSEVTFITSTGAWIANDDDINLAADATYAVNAAAGSTVTLPELNIEEGTKGKVDWGDGTKENFSREGTKSSVENNKITFSHTYANAFEGKVLLIVEEGKISGNFSSESEFAKFTINNPSVVDVHYDYVPELISGVFTVNNSGKKVKFTNGNLYWNGAEFRCEGNQYDFPGSKGSGDSVWAVNDHLGHFVWSKDARVALHNNPDVDIQSVYSKYDAFPATTDKLFAADGGVFDGFTVLSKDEWEYLIKHSFHLGPVYVVDHIEYIEPIAVRINGKYCAVLKPDGFHGNIADSYTAEEWAAAETTYGLVALPMAGFVRTWFFNFNHQCSYFSSTPDPDDKDAAWGMKFSPFFDPAEVKTITLNRSNYLHQIRLVKVIQEKTYKPELISGVFTVNNSGKKVKFTNGNLYWNGAEFRCEENQYDCPLTWNTSHVGHFFWSNDARVAYSKDYDIANSSYGITPRADDIFFAADGGALEGLTVLSEEEWQYLLEHALERDSSNKVSTIPYKRVHISSRDCVILKPDGFSGTVADSYTAEEWASAESIYGLVALPLAGLHSSGANGLSNYYFNPYAENYGFFWSSSSSSVKYGYTVHFIGNQSAGTNVDYRKDGYAVRLVSVQ